jgi:hypothetical protein
MACLSKNHGSDIQMKTSSCQNIFCFFQKQKITDQMFTYIQVMTKEYSKGIFVNLQGTIPMVSEDEFY